MQELSNQDEVIHELITLLALAASLWLGFYILTRSPNSTLSRIAALTLWVFSGYFLYIVLIQNSPPAPLLSWLHQLILLVGPLWLHLTYLLYSKPGKSDLRLVKLNRYAIPLAYVAAVAQIAMGALPSNPPVGLFNDRLAERTLFGILGYGSRVGGLLFIVFLANVSIVAGLSLVNLWQARGHMRMAMGRASNVLLIGTVLAAAGAAYSRVLSGLMLDIPSFPGDLLIGVGIVLLGYTVARYSALLEGRPLDRDFIYAILTVGSLTAFYVLIVLILYVGNQVPFVTVVLTLVGMIAAISLFDAIRLTFDRLFYQRQFQLLRENLSALAREAGTSETLSKHLQAFLDAVCRAYHILQGFIALRRGDHYVIEASYDSGPLGQTFDLEALAAYQSVGLLPTARKGLSGMTLLTPLFAGGSQIGAMVLGAKATQQPYNDADLLLLEDLGDQLASLIHGLTSQEESARAINAMVQEFREKERALQWQMQQLVAARQAQTQVVSEESILPQVEEALRRLDDFSCLGELPLAKLNVVRQCLPDPDNGSEDFIERGKALSQVLVGIVDELRPNTPEPKKSEVPPREWHPFIILHDAYVQGEPNRNIMSRLYIGEGTFNRARRRALRSVAKSLVEKEGQAASHQ